MYLGLWDIFFFVGSPTVRADTTTFDGLPSQLVRAAPGAKLVSRTADIRPPPPKGKGPLDVTFASPSISTLQPQHVAPFSPLPLIARDMRAEECVRATAGIQRESRVGGEQR
jgi:hypothetical protein